VKRKNQQDATNSIFTIKLLSQHVSGIIMPIIRRTRLCTTACGVLHWVCRLWLAVVLCSCVLSCVHCVKFTVHTAQDAAPQDHSQPQPTHSGRTSHAVGHGLVLLMMGIMMPETCWDRSLIVKIELVASCWFFLFTLCIYTLQDFSVFLRTAKRTTHDLSVRYFVLALRLAVGAELAHMQMDRLLS